MNFSCEIAVETARKTCLFFSGKGVTFLQLQSTTSSHGDDSSKIHTLFQVFNSKFPRIFCRIPYLLYSGFSTSSTHPTITKNYLLFKNINNGGA